VRRLWRRGFIMNEPSAHTAPQWEPAARAESLSWSIVRQIRDALFSGKLKAGEFIGSEITLAQQFGVSRIAARDALRSLIAMGVVEVRMGSRGGAWVAMGNSDRLVDSLAVQLHLIGLTAAEMLEAQSITSIASAELAAGRVTPEDAARMEEAAQATEAAAGDPHAFTEASMRFREAIVNASKNRVLIAQYRAFGSVLGPLLEANTTAAATRRIIQSNARLLQAIVNGDAVAAGELMRERESGIRMRILGSDSTATTEPAAQAPTP
jgi:GntR family transcriptional regulator, transcriptional repressor for pyruvate dehydrogenase complex